MARLKVVLCLALVGVCSGQFALGQDVGAAPAAPAPASELPSWTESLNPFTGVSLCTPLNLLVTPSGSEQDYSITFQAEQSVLDALDYRVESDTLYLESEGDFATNRPINVTVALPSSSFERLEHYGTGAKVVVAPGFEVPSFTATSAFGGSDVYVMDLTAQEAAVSSSGIGNIVLMGSFGVVDLSSTGEGTAYIIGVNESVNVDLSGVSGVYIRPSSPQAVITGTAGITNFVRYTQGSCEVTSTSPLAVFVPPLFSISPCRTVAFVIAPPPQPVWTCGIQVSGNFSCGDGGEAFVLSSGGDLTTSGDVGSPVTTAATPPGTLSIAPDAFQFAAPTQGGTQQQSGSLTPGGSTADSAISGTGSVSATSVAGPGISQTQTTQDGQATGFQTTGQQTTGFGLPTLPPWRPSGRAWVQPPPPHPPPTYPHPPPALLQQPSTAIATSNGVGDSTSSASATSFGDPSTASSQTASSFSGSVAQRLQEGGAQAGSAASDTCFATTAELRMLEV